MTTATLTPAQLAAASPAYWAGFSKIRLGSEPFSFVGHQYQIEPMQSQARRLCCMKGTQGGWTLLLMLCKLHGLIHCKYKSGVLYMFPTTDNVQEFSKSRFAPLISDNPQSVGRFVKAGGKGTDTASLKKVHDAFLYLRGARLSQSVGGMSDEKESVQVRSIPVDSVVFDEVDLMDEAVIAKALGRMGHSSVKEEVYLSNPILPGAGIDKIFQQSDQRHWFRKCGCGTETCAELSFPDCVRVGEDGRGYIACSKCGKPTDLDRGRWIPQRPENSDYMHGYRWSQLTSAYNDPADILREFQDPPQGNLADVYRLRLGLPYVAAEDKLTVPTVMECCGKDLMPTTHRGPCAMGVDIGKMFHVVIGIRTGQERYEIVKMARVSDWEGLHELARRYGIRTAVIDQLPYEDGARKFQKSEPFRSYLCRYLENSPLGAQFNDDQWLVKVDRTESCDGTHRIITQKRVTLPRDGEEVRVFAQQCCNMAKVLETNKKTGIPIYRYRKLSDEDHYRHAFGYFVLAANKVQVTSEATRHNHVRTAISEYQVA